VTRKKNTLVCLWLLASFLLSMIISRFTADEIIERLSVGRLVIYGVVGSGFDAKTLKSEGAGKRS
jgi:hypothetical protein